MQKICLISPKFDEHVGGMETHAYEFASHFINCEDHKLTSIITRKNVSDGIPAKIQNLDPRIKKIMHKVLTADLKEDLKHILQYSSAKTNIYFFNTTNWLPIIHDLKKQRNNSKIIVRSGGTDLAAGWIGDESNTEQNFLKNQKKLVKIINSEVDYLIVNSNFSENRCLKIGIDKNKIIRLTGGVNIYKFNSRKKKRISKHLKILNVSRLVKCKGLEHSIETIRRLSNNKNNFEFVIVGDGPERKHLEKLAKKLGVQRKVNFVGAVPYTKVSSYFKNSDIYLHLPITHKKKSGKLNYEHVESMGRSFCEAAAAGIPSIATSVGGVPEVVTNNLTGYLVPEQNISLATKKLQKLIDNNSLRVKMGKTARKKAVQCFNWIIIFRKYKELFTYANLRS